MKVRFLVVISAVLSLAACGGRTSSRPPEPLRGEPGSVENIALQARDVPEGMVRCDYSAAMGTYLENIKELSPTGYTQIGGTWAQLQAAGATEGWITVFADTSDVCRGWLVGGQEGDLNTAARILSSVVVRFPDMPSAEASFRADIFKQSLLETVPRIRVLKGPATKLGENAIVGSDEQVRPARHQAVWQQDVYNVFVVGREVTRAEFEAAITAAAARVP